MKIEFEFFNHVGKIFNFDIARLKYSTNYWAISRSTKSLMQIANLRHQRKLLNRSSLSASDWNINEEMESPTVCANRNFLIFSSQLKKLFQSRIFLFSFDARIYLGESCEVFRDAFSREKFSICWQTESIPAHQKKQLEESLEWKSLSGTSAIYQKVLNWSPSACETIMENESKGESETSASRLKQ